MTLEEWLFGNFLKSPTITSFRLVNCASHAVNKGIKEDPTNQFLSLRTSLNAAQTTLSQELSDVSGALATQKGKTMTVDNILASFKDNMSNLEGMIAFTLGGKDQPAFQDFYPQGVSEYRNATKEQVPTLMQRVADKAGIHAATLGVPVSTLLQQFAADWNSARDRQEEQKGELAQNRTERSQARIATELVFLSYIHAVSSAFPGDVKRCSRFFDFGLLYVKGQGSEETGDDENDNASQPES